MKVTLSQLQDIITEAVKTTIAETKYYKDGNRGDTTDEKEHEEWLQRKAAARKAYYDNLKKEQPAKGKGGAIDYKEYKHGEHPEMVKEASEVARQMSIYDLDEALKSFLASVNKFCNERPRDASLISGDIQKLTATLQNFQNSVMKVVQQDRNNWKSMEADMVEWVKHNTDPYEFLEYIEEKYGITPEQFHTSGGWEEWDRLTGDNMSDY